MSEPTHKSQLSTGKVITGFFIIGLVLGGIGMIFFSQGKDATNDEASSCLQDKALASKIDPFAKGELVALSVFKNPLPFNDLEMVNETGEKVSMAQMKGKSLLVNIWATWCAPCRREMPDLDRLQADKGNDTFEVVAINIDAKTSDKDITFLDKIKIKSLHRYKDIEGKVFGTLQKASRLQGLPTTYLIGPQGCEIARLAGPAHWASSDAYQVIDALNSAQ